MKGREMMSSVNTQTTVNNPVKTPHHQSKNNLYKTVWRWHFYAGIIFAPFIIFLSITGGIYLFKPQIEDKMYHDLYYVQQGEQQLSSTELMKEVQKNYPNADITSFTPSFAADRSSVVGMNDYGESVSMYVDPYTGDIIGSMNENDRFMAFIKNLHNGELWGGTLGNRLVELAACWTIILLITGVYLWWPRNKKAIFGTLLPRLRMSKDKRLFWRDLHSVTAIWLSLFIVIQLVSGLMWSGVWGNMANGFVSKTGAGSPVGINAWEAHAFPKSTLPTKEIADDVPWAAENMPVPESNDKGTTPISIDEVIETVREKQVHPGYKVVLPQDSMGVYTVFLSPSQVYPNRPMPWAQQTLHIDQYDGKALADLGWKDYGILGKLITLGIAFHQGDFGVTNQLFVLALVIGIVLIVVSGLVMWWKRKPKGKLGAPTYPQNYKLLKGVAFLIIILGLFFPLVGISLLLVWILDYLVLKRIPIVKQWLG